MADVVAEEASAVEAGPEWSEYDSEGAEVSDAAVVEAMEAAKLEAEEVRDLLEEDEDELAAEISGMDDDVAGEIQDASVTQELESLMMMEGIEPQLAGQGDETTAEVGQRSRVVTMYRGSVQRAAFLERVLQKRHLSSVGQELIRRKEQMAQLKEQVSQANEFTSGLQSELAALQAEERELLSRPVVPQDKLAIIDRARDKVTVNLDHQRDIVERSKADLEEARLALRFLEVDAAEVDERMDSLLKLDAMEVANQQRLAQTLRTREQAAVRRVERARDKTRQAQMESELRQIEYEKKVLKNAREARKLAIDRLAKQRQQINTSLAEIEAQGQESRSSRINALLNLKHTIDNARKEMVKRNELRAARREKNAIKRAKEAAELTEAGQNAHEVFLRSEERARVAKELKQRAAARREREAKLSENLQKEERLHKKEKERQRVERAYIEYFQREKGLDATEERTRLYMKSMTNDGREMLDPTGRHAIRPSEIMQLKTWKFGLCLGDDDPKLIASLRKKHGMDDSLGPDLSPQDSIERSQTPDSFSNQNAGIGAIASSLQREKKTKEYKPKLSKMQVEAMQEAHLRHRDGIVQKQVCMGREFVGPAFLFNPAKIEFKDVVVGKKYRKKVIATNVSYMQNTFKLSELPEPIKDLVSIDYSFPGMLSPGMTCPLTITFEAKKTVDIVSEIGFLSKTGELSLPIACRVKCANVSFSTSVVDFGRATLDSIHTIAFTMSNSGAIPCTFTIQDKVPGLSPFTYPDSGAIDASGRCRIEISFDPPAEEVYEREIEVKIVDSEQRINSKSIRLRGEGTQIAVVARNPDVDFKHCVYQNAYRHEMTLVNRGNIALNVKIIRRQEIDEYIEIYPASGFVQGMSHYTFHAKFRPQPGILERCERFVDPVTGCLDVPIRVEVPDQKPVIFHLKANITTNDLVFEPSVLHFGSAHIGESVATELNITNPSSLPQEFGFLKLPPEIAIKDGDGFGMVLPGETVTKRVVFSAAEIKGYDMELCCKTLMGKIYSIRYKADCVFTPLLLSHSVIKMAATPVGETAYASFFLENVSSEPKIFEAGFSADSNITITPKVETIGPGARMRLELQYKKPRAEETAEDAQEGTATDNNNNSSKKGTPEKTGGEGNIGQEGDETKTTDDVDADEETGPRVCKVPFFIEGKEKHVLYLEVHTCDIEDELKIEGLDTKSESEYHLFPFGSVPVKQFVKKTFYVRSLTKRKFRLSASPPDHDGTFTVIHKMPIFTEEGQVFPLSVVFAPLSARAHEEQLTLSSGRQRISIKMSGEGINPSINLEPVLDMYDMGNLCAGGVAEKELTLTNTSDFELSFQMRPAGKCHLNLDGKNPFYCRPEEGTLQPGASRTCVISFCPDHEYQFFDDEIGVYFGNQKQKALKFQGRCWTRGLFVCSAADMPPPLDSWMPLSSLSRRGGGEAPSGVELRTIIMPEEAFPGGSTSTTLEIGNLKAAKEDGNDSGEFVIHGLTDFASRMGWAIDALKGKVETGKTLQVVISFSPPAEVSPDTLAFYGIDDWSELPLEISVKGGSPKLAGPSKYIVNIKCFFRAKPPEVAVLQEEAKGEAKEEE